MDFNRNHSANSNNHLPSPSSSTSTASSTATPNPPTNPTATATTTTTDNNDHMQSWWESISKARSRIHSLSSILPIHSDSFSLSSLADSDRPALSLLSSPHACFAISAFLSSPHSGSVSDPLCHWLYDTFLSADPHLRLVVLSFLPLLSSLYLSRIHSASSNSPSLPSLAGLEAVLLAIYSSEVKSRAGKPVLVTIPDLSQPSLYHTPRNRPNSGGQSPVKRPLVGVLCPPLEPQIAIKSTKRASIVGVAFDCYYKQISQMPSWSKLEFCRSSAAWAGHDCCCHREFDDKEDEFENGGLFSDTRVLENGNEIENAVEEFDKLSIQKYEDKNFGVSESSVFTRIPLPWELLLPVLRILGHCLLGPLNAHDVKSAASTAVRFLYARASHDLVPQAILATRSLIQLDKRANEGAKDTSMANTISSNVNTPTKVKKPEILLVSK